jgi:hypothetical protein
MPVRDDGGKYVSQEQYNRDRDDDREDIKTLNKKVDEVLERVYAIVPRSEHEARWEQNDTRFHRLETKVEANYTALENRVNTAILRSDERIAGQRTALDGRQIQTLLGAIALIVSLLLTPVFAVGSGVLVYLFTHH